MKSASSDVMRFMRAGRQRIGSTIDPSVKPVGPVLSLHLQDLAKHLNGREDALKTCGETDSDKLSALRVRLITEEVAELLLAVRSGNTTEVADALGDILYVTIGAAIAWGIKIDMVWDAIHKSNMAKFVPCSECDNVFTPSADCVCDGTGLTRLLDASGKIMKPPSWSPPDIEGLLRSQSLGQ